MGLIPGLGRPPGEGNGYPLQYSCLFNLMDRGACFNSQTRLSDWTTNLSILFCMLIFNLLSYMNFFPNHVQHFQISPKAESRSIQVNSHVWLPVTGGRASMAWVQTLAPRGSPSARLLAVFCSIISHTSSSFPSWVPAAFQRVWTSAALIWFCLPISYSVCMLEWRSSFLIMHCWLLGATVFTENSGVPSLFLIICLNFKF